MVQLSLPNKTVEFNVNRDTVGKSAMELFQQADELTRAEFAYKHAKTRVSALSAEVKTHESELLKAQATQSSTETLIELTNLLGQTKSQLERAKADLDIFFILKEKYASIQRKHLSRQL